MKYLILTNHSYMLWQFRRELIQRLLERGQVVIGTPFCGRQEEFARIGCRCVETPMDRRGITPGKDLRLLAQYRSLLRTERPDLVLTYAIKPNIYGGGLCRSMGIPYCANVQGLGSAFSGNPMAALVTELYRRALDRAGTVFFENRADEGEFLYRGILRGEHTVLHGAGVNLAHYGMQPYPVGAEGVTFLFLGRFMREKGVAELLSAARKLKSRFGEQVRFVLAGFFEEPYQKAVEGLVREGVAEFLGFVPDPRPCYRRAHCVVIPSYREGVSNVLLEAAASGRPVIASDVPGCREAVEDGRTGLLVPPGNAEALYQGMCRFLALSPEARREMGLLAREKMVREFDRERVVAQTLAVLMRVG